MGVTALVLLWGAAVLGLRFLPTPAAVAVGPSFEWSYVGKGDDVSYTFDVETAGAYLVEWFSPCGAALTLIEWSGTSQLGDIAVGEGTDTTATVSLTVGEWFVQVESACRWAVSVSRT
jgi:hypothetical protein